MFKWLKALLQQNQTKYISWRERETEREGGAGGGGGGGNAAIYSILQPQQDT